MVRAARLAVMLAQVNSRKACDKIRMSVVTLNSVELQIKQQECMDAHACVSAGAGVHLVVT